MPTEQELKKSAVLKPVVAFGNATVDFVTAMTAGVSTGSQPFKTTDVAGLDFVPDGNLAKVVLFGLADIIAAAANVPDGGKPRVVWIDEVNILAHFMRQADLPSVSRVRFLPPNVVPFVVNTSLVTSVFSCLLMQFWSTIERVGKEGQLASVILAGSDSLLVTDELFGT